jgi:hypothetical protein
MKRPKLADMTLFEEVHWRLLQARRCARRNLRIMVSVEMSGLTPEQQADALRLTLRFKTVIAITKPSWVRSSSFNDAIGAYKHVSCVCEGTPQRAN